MFVIYDSDGLQHQREAAFTALACGVIISSWIQTVLSIHCLAALDLGAGVEQQFDCLIVQNRQTMRSMRSMDWTLETTRSTVCSSAPHSQAAEEATPHLYKQDRKRPTPVWRRLRRTHAVLRKGLPGGWLPVSRMKVRSLVTLSGVTINTNKTQILTQ